MREEEMKKRIKDSAEHVVIPESLKPEQMMKKLSEPGREEGAGTKPAAKPVKRKRHSVLRFGAVAAATFIAVGLFTINKGSISGTKASGLAAAQTQGALEAASVPEEQLENMFLEEAGQEQSGQAEAAFLAQSYDQIYDRFQALKAEQEQELEYIWEAADDGFPAPAGIAREEMAIAETSAAMEAPEMAAAGASSEGNSGAAKAVADGAYSQTNIQVEGVDEGDIVKTDGTYIYVASADSGSIRIIRPEGSSMEKAGEIPDTSTVQSSRRIEEFYLNGDKMTVVRSAYETRDKSGGPGAGQEQAAVSGTPGASYYYGIYDPGKPVTVIETYDLSDRQQPKPLGTVVQDGYFQSSRRNGDHVYVFTRYDVNVYAQRKEIEQYVPFVNGEALPASCIYIPEAINAFNYLVVCSVDMNQPEKALQSKAVAASGEHYYVSRENIYIASAKYDYRASQYDYTELMKLSYNGGKIGFKAHGKVNGYLNNQFSMDEYQGNLRLVSTLSNSRGKDTNALYVLNEKLEKIGEIKDLAPDEQIYSARFMGDTGYFVTFRNMDPLFSVDLSDPANPKILGELKITGFSEYLHPYADGLLLGIGSEIDPETTGFEGLKLSMFDTSNPKNVREVQKLVEESYEYSPAWNNHKSVLISASRNLIGFSVEHYDYDNRQWQPAYVIYSYSKAGGFQKKLSAPLAADSNYRMARGLYINDWLYVVENSRINAYHLENFAHSGELNY